eukprot:gene1919-2601_t
MDVAAPSARRLFVTADTKAGARKVAVILDGGDDWDAFRRKLADKFGDTTLKYGAFTLEKNGAEVSEAPELMDGDELRKVAVEEPEILVVESEPEEEIASGPSYLDIFRKAVEKVQAATRFYSDILSGSPDFEIHVSTTPLVPGEDNGESAIVRKLSLPRRRRIAEALLANEGIVPGRCWHVGPYAKGDFVGSQVHDGVTDVSDEEAWAEAIRTFPWTLGARLARTSSHLCGQLNVDDKESRTLVEMLHFTAAEASQLTSRDHEIAEHVVITLWWLLLHDSGMDFRDALLELSLVEQLINRLDIMVDGMKFEPSAVVARQLRTIMGCLGMLLLSPTGVQRLVEPRADRVTTPKAPPSAPAMGGRSTTRTIVAMSMEPDMSLTSAHCWEVLVRAASVLSPIELALPHPEIIGIGLLRRCLLQDVEAARHSFIVGYGVAHLILLMKAPTATVRQSAGALLGSLSENGGWETIAKVGSANELLAAMVEMVETSCTEELTLDEDGSSAARSYSEQVDSARMWAKAGRALCGVSKAVVAQGEKVSEKALRSLIGAAGATYRSHTARHAAAGVVGAMGDLARARKYASALMKFEVAPALVGMLECYDIMTRMQAAAAIGCLAWHGELEHPCGPEMLPGPVPLQGGHRRMLVLVGVLRKLLYCLRDGISVDDAVTKAKMLMGDEIDLSLVMARHTIHTRLLKSATCAALMLLAADEQEHERSDLASFVQAAEMCTDENPAALLFLSAGIWCLTRVPRNRLRLLGASAIAQLVELSWRTWTSLKGDEQLHQLPTDGRLKMTYHPLLHALEWLFGAIWMLASSNGEQACASEIPNISKYLVDHDVLDMLVTIVRCDGAPLPARVQCYQLCQLLACTPEGKTQMPVEEMAHLLVFLMQTKYVSLQEISTRGCAILAGETNIHRTRVILAEVGAIDVLMAHAKRPNTHIIREMAVKALLNLSTVADNQVAICKKGLYLLLRLNQDEEGDPDIKRCTSALLHNLSKNAANRTRLYKAELRTKSGSVQEAWAESGDWRHDQATWAQGEAARRSVYFSDGVGSEESEAQTPRPSTQMEGRYLEDREAKMHLQKDMCKPVASLWNKFTADTYGLDLGQLPNSTRWQPKASLPSVGETLLDALATQQEDGAAAEPLDFEAQNVQALNLKIQALPGVQRNPRALPGVQRNPQALPGVQRNPQALPAFVINFSTAQQDSSSACGMGGGGASRGEGAGGYRAGVGGSAVNLDHLRGLCERPPGPGKHTMNIVAHACTNCPGCKKHGHISAAPMKMCVQLIRHEDVPTTDISQYIPANRPQIYEQLSMPVGNSPLAVLTSAMTKEPWELDNSVFAPRKEEAECRDYWDSEKVTRDMFEIDWQLLTSEGPKGRFVSMITNRFRNLDMAELVKSMARQHYDLICRVYDYYCCLGSGGNHFSMQTNEWTMFLKEAEVLDNGMKSRTKRADCDQIFQLINQIIQVPKDGVSPDNRKAAPVVVAPPRGAMGRRKSLRERRRGGWEVTYLYVQDEVTPEGASDGDTSDGWKKLKNVLHMKAISQKQNTKLKTVIAQPPGCSLSLATAAFLLHIPPFSSTPLCGAGRRWEAESAALWVWRVTDRGVDLLLDILRYLDGYYKLKVAPCADQLALNRYLVSESAMASLCAVLLTVFLVNSVANEQDNAAINWCHYAGVEATRLTSDAKHTEGSLYRGVGGLIKMKRRDAIAFELHALLRFEFIAAVIRLGIAKFLDEKTHVEKGNIPKALDLLCFFIRENIEKNRQEALISVNDFRTQRLYTEEVDALYKSEERLLHALYKHYKGANSFDLTKNMMKLDGWLALMEHSNVIGHESNVSIREVNLCFSWSRMDFSNEMSTKDTFGACFTYVDFLEGLGRLSDFISPPEPSMVSTDEAGVAACLFSPLADYVLEHDVKYSSTENDEWVAQFGPTYRFYSLIRNNRALSDKTLEKGRRTSEGFLTENTRPLQVLCVIRSSDKDRRCPVVSHGGSLKERLYLTVVF